MRIVVVAQETVIIVKEKACNSPERIRARRSRRRIERDERHRLADRFDGIGRADKIRPLGGGDLSRSVNGLQCRRPPYGYDVKATVAAEVAERGRFFRAEHDDRVDLARREPVERFRQWLIGLIRSHAQAGKQHSAAGRCRAVEIAEAHSFSLEVADRLNFARRATKGTRFIHSGSPLALDRRQSSETMAKSTMSVLRTLPRPFGEVEPTTARPAAPLALITVAKSLAIRLALASPGSARTANSFAATGWGSGASARTGLAAPGAAY